MFHSSWNNVQWACINYKPDSYLIRSGINMNVWIINILTRSNLFFKWVGGPAYPTHSYMFNC